MVTTYQMKNLSTLELMLEELQQEDEETNDLPPPLPVRPVIKARLPKGRRKLAFGKEKSNLEDIRVQENVFVDQWSTSAAERDSVAMTDKVLILLTCSRLDCSILSSLGTCYLPSALVLLNSKV